jgi:NAD(P)-dependent dehydrogenase (short-subunit alcohol dehydrogenase family)
VVLTPACPRTRGADLGAVQLDVGHGQQRRLRPDGDFEDTSEELFEALHRVILKGPYFLTQKLVPLLADGGAIVNTTATQPWSPG